MRPCRFESRSRRGRCGASSDRERSTAGQPALLLPYRRMPKRGFAGAGTASPTTESCWNASRAIPQGSGPTPATDRSPSPWPRTFRRPVRADRAARCAWLVDHAGEQGIEAVAHRNRKWHRRRAFATTPSGRTRYSDSAEGSSDSIQNRHQPAESQPRNWASTGAACPGWGAGGSARIVIGTDNKPSNAAPAASKLGDALSTKGMNRVISDSTSVRPSRKRCAGIGRSAPRNSNTNGVRNWGGRTEG